MPRQSQILAVERGIKSKAQKGSTELFRALQAPQLFAGFTKNYVPLEEGTEAFPLETQRVQMVMADVEADYRQAEVEAITVTSTKNHGNTIIKADIVVDGVLILKDIAPPDLIDIGNKLKDVYTFYSKAPTLDPAYDWDWDASLGVWKTPVAKSHRGQKVQRPIVLYDATEHHPAQTAMVSEDIIVGHWHTTKFSGAMPLPLKKKRLARIVQLQKAVQFAIQEANAQPIKDVRSGVSIFDFIFAD